MKNLLYTFLIVLLCSCIESDHQRTLRLAKEWTGKTVYLPVDSVFESFDTDSIRKYSLKRTDYTVVAYVDSSTCATNNLKLRQWQQFVDDLHRFDKGKVTCLLYFHPERRDTIIDQFQRENFNYPVCIDQDDLFNKLNHFPDDPKFRIFLLNADRQIVAYGNPLTDRTVREKYLAIIASAHHPLKV